MRSGRTRWSLRRRTSMRAWAPCSGAAGVIAGLLEAGVRAVVAGGIIPTERRIAASANPRDTSDFVPRFMRGTFATCSTPGEADGRDAALGFGWRGRAAL